MTVADVYYAIGKTHDVCQDYGIAEDPYQSGLDGHRAVAVVCDGCSSSPDTDWGARFLARAAAGTFDPFDPLTVVRRADTYRDVLKLSPMSLDATLMVARETKDGDAEVRVYGDGVVVARKRDGSGYESWSLSYSINAPAYLSYLLDQDRLAEYRRMGGGILTRTTNKGEADLICPPQKVDNPEEVVPDHQPSFHRVFPRAEYDVVLIMSDGAESFQKREGTRFVPVPLADVVAQVLDFKTLTTGFIKRRVGRFLTKFCVQNEWQHNDDFTVAGLVLDPPTAEVTP